MFLNFRRDMPDIPLPTLVESQRPTISGDAVPISAGRVVGQKMISIVVPCLNEEQCIGEFVDWCREGLKKAGRVGQILIIDSSTDRSAEIAEEHGAEVLRTPKRGLGRAYIDALPHIKGDYVVMGD